MFITSFGGEDEAEETSKKRDNMKNISGLVKSLKQEAKLDTTMQTVKRLKQNVSSSRSSGSRSRSKSPVTTKKSNDTDDTQFKKSKK